MAEDGGAGRAEGAGKKRRAIISQLLEISVSINLVSPPAASTMFCVPAGWLFPVRRGLSAVRANVIRRGRANMLI